MLSCFAIIPWAQLHSRAFQWFLLPHQKAGNGSSLIMVQVPPEVTRSLEWWLSPAISKGSLFREPDRITLTTDASLSGWGAHLQSGMAQGQCFQSDLQHNINWLELQAVWLALIQFQQVVTDKYILVLTDNMTAKAHIHRQGGTHSRALMQEAARLGVCAEAHLLSIRAEHIFRVSNVQADCLSHSQIDQAEWKPHPDLFQELTTRYRMLTIYLFATKGNRQVP